MPAVQAATSQRDSARVFTLQSHEIDANSEWIARILGMGRKREWTADEVLTDLKNGKAQLWGCASSDGVGGIWITRIEQIGGTPTGGRVWVAVGRGLRDGLRFFREFTEPWLLECCDRIVIEGRKGWERILPDYKREGALLVKYGHEII